MRSAAGDIRRVAAIVNQSRHVQRGTWAPGVEAICADERPAHVPQLYRPAWLKESSGIAERCCGGLTSCGDQVVAQNGHVVS